ncbi:MAG TPA: hypothetical protein VGM20_07575 [Gemmatimonadales bacterium]|jgi:hypothetical protein
MHRDHDNDPGLADEIASLRNAPPSTDLWPGIARQLEPRQPRGTLLIRWPVAIAAGLVLAVATSAGTLIALRLTRSPAAPAATTTVAAAPTAPAGTSPAVAASFAPADSALAGAINDLERAVRSNLSHVDPEARNSINQSLTLLDQAIAQAAARQSAAPNDPRVASYLTSTLRKKLQLLRTVSELTRRES